ncbi:MAG: thioredoxin family protein, partial [Acidobacteriota bacterium]
GIRPHSFTQRNQEVDPGRNVNREINHMRNLTFYLKIIILISFRIMETGCTHETNHAAGRNPDKDSSSVKGEVLVTNNIDLDFSQHKVTFIELGAAGCVPCKAMQPIMKEIAQEYAGKIQVVFYDVWKDPRPARHYPPGGLFP